MCETKCCPFDDRTFFVHKCSGEILKWVDSSDVPMPLKVVFKIFFENNVAKTYNDQIRN